MKARTFRRRVLAALAAALTALPVAASAGEIADKAAEAESLLSGGKPQEALAAFDQASEDFWNASPLQMRVATFVESVAGFGDYQPLAKASFKAGDTLFVPKGAPLGWKCSEDVKKIYCIFLEKQKAAKSEAAE